MENIILPENLIDRLHLIFPLLAYETDFPVRCRLIAARTSVRSIVVFYSYTIHW